MITSELECAGSCTVVTMPERLFPDGFVASARFTFGLAADGSWEVAHMQQQSSVASWPAELFCGGGEAGTSRNAADVVEHAQCSAVQCGCGVATEDPADPGAAALPDPGQAVVQWDACCVCDGVSDCLDACGVPNGANASCTDACGVVLGDNATCLDACGVPNGDDGCVGCDGEPFSGLVVDACDVCDGDNSTCSDCEGTPNGETVVDGCGVCGGEHDIIVAADAAQSVQAHECFDADAQEQTPPALGATASCSATQLLTRAAYAPARTNLAPTRAGCHTETTRRAPTCVECCSAMDRAVSTPVASPSARTNLAPGATASRTRGGRWTPAEPGKPN